MKWKDTVLTLNDVIGKFHSVKPSMQEALETQAEKSYTAGVEAGTKRVIEQVDIHENELGFCEISNHIPYADWQAKLAEWRALRKELKGLV